MPVNRDAQGALYTCEGCAATGAGVTGTSPSATMQNKPIWMPMNWRMMVLGSGTAGVYNTSWNLYPSDVEKFAVYFCGEACQDTWLAQHHVQIPGARWDTMDNDPAWSGRTFNDDD